MSFVGLWIDAGSAACNLGGGATTRTIRTSFAGFTNRGAGTAVIFIGAGVETRTAARHLVGRRTARCTNAAVTRHAVAAGLAAGTAVFGI
jgi:hypothetical protein